MLLVVIDAHRKWRDILVCENTTAEETVCTLPSLFALLALPDQIVPDNGPHDTSDVCFPVIFTNGKWY